MNKNAKNTIEFFFTKSQININGNIWIGSYENGLSFYSNNKSKFSSLSYDQENEWGLRDNKIYSITSLSFGSMMWIATDYGLENISSDGSRDYEYSKKTLDVNYIYDSANNSIEIKEGTYHITRNIVFDFGLNIKLNN